MIETSILQWLVGALGATVTVVITAVIVLLRVAFRLGSIAHEVTTTVNRLTKIEKNTDLVPVHETRITTMENEVTSLRRKVYGVPSSPDIQVGGE